MFIKCVVKAEHSTPALEKGYLTTFSQLKMDWCKYLYINFKSFLHVQNHPDLPRLNGQSCGFLPFSIFPTRLHERQLLMSRLQQQFLRSQHDRWSRISLWETNWPPTESITMNKSSFPPSNSVQCLISRLLPSWDLFLHKPKPWGDMKTNIKKRKLNPEWRNWRHPIHPRASRHPCNSTAWCTVYCYSPYINTGSLNEFFFSSSSHG